MASYADYTYYAGASYLGTAIASADFPRLAMRASALIDMVTFDQAAAIVTAGTDTATIDKIKKATCAIAEQYQAIDYIESGGGEIASERVGQHSVTYVTGKSAQSSTEVRLLNVAKLYLWNTELLYGGPEITGNEIEF